jgi:signal transduction histidine kinase/ligand-binding sensor domain-containing protein
VKQVKGSVSKGWFGKFVLLAGACLLWASAAAGQERARTGGISNRLDIVQLHHRAFTSADGAPMRVSDIVQDRDGYLWMTSKSGLYRFDGVHFDQSLGKRLPSRLVKGIYADNDGSLWVGYYFGGVSHVVNARIQTYRDGLPPGTVFAFARMADGALWLASTGGLARYDSGRWRVVGAEMGYDGSTLEDMSQSKDGRLWLTTAGHAYFVLRPGGTRFEPTDRATALSQVWGLPPSFDERLLGLVSTPFVDSAGALWLPSVTGIQRFRWKNGLDKLADKEDFGTAEGLSDATASAFFEDRDSNVWAATALGLDQFRENRITPHEVDDHLFMPTMAFDSDGVAWVGTTWGAYRLTPDSTRFPELGQYFSCVTRDRLGDVWMAGQSGLFHIVHGQISKVPAPTTEPSAVTRYQSIALDGEGTLWVAISGLGLYRLDNGKWSRLDSLAGLPTNHLTRLVGDARGRLWVAFGDGHVVRKDKETTRTFDKRDGLNIGAVTDIALGRANVLLGGELGLVQIVRDRFYPVVGTGGHVFEGISGVVQLSSGEVWLQDDGGIVRISADEMRQAVGDPTHEVAYELFDAEDGLIGKADKVRPLPSLAEGRDGRLWITTTREVASIDTRHVIRNLHPVKPSVTTVTAGGTLYPASGKLTLPPHTRSMQIEFTAPALTLPARTTFRAKLVGVDDRWQDLGARREAFYTNLAPGEYRFELEVTNEDGVASAMTQPLYLNLQPAFYQTLWFRALMGLAAATGLFWLYRRRLALVHHQARIRLEERERIARELHDTLLQSTQGLLLEVESVVRGGPIDEGSRSVLERALTKARDVVIEGRSRVNELRLGTDDADCPLESYLEHLEDTGEGSNYATVIEGRIRRLVVDKGHEVVAIIREALRNAVRHADASAITLRIRYGSLHFTVMVSDDGAGIPEGVLHARQQEGHWGIAGMRERARRIGGSLQVISKLGQGTRITVSVSSRRIYRRPN